MERIEKDLAALRFIEEVTSQCDEVQRKVLGEILSKNADTQYLKRHGVKAGIDPETFKSKVPVVTYEDIQPDIQRIANGDFFPILCSQPITEFLTRKKLERNCGGFYVGNLLGIIQLLGNYADTNTIPGHYVIYWELLTKDPTNGPSHAILDRCCLAMEEALNSVYRQCRVADQSIGLLEIRVVKNGTFEELMDYAISRGASINQYKTPRWCEVLAHCGVT